MKTVLIPIDFTIESLNTVKIAIEENKHESVHVILMYAENLTSSISELLFYSSPKVIQSHLSPQFSEALSILKNTYETTIKSMRIVLFHGYNKQSFINFHEGLKVNSVYFPMNYKLSIKKKGFDPIPLIKKSNIAYKEVAWPFDNLPSEPDELNQLFK